MALSFKKIPVGGNENPSLLVNFCYEIPFGYASFYKRGAHHLLLPFITHRIYGYIILPTFG